MFRFLYIVLFFASFLNAELNLTKKIKAGMPANFQPYFYLDKQSNETGFAVEVFKEIVKEAGIDYEIVVFPTYVDVEKAYANKNIDLIIAGGISEKRKKIGNFTTPIDTSIIKSYKLKSNPIEKLEFIDDKKITLKINNVSVKLFKDYPKNLIRYVNSKEEGLLTLLTKESEVFIFNEVAVTQMLEKSGFENLVVPFGEPIKSVDFAIRVQKSEPNLVIKLDEALKEFKKTYRFEELYSKFVLGRKIKQELNLNLTKEEQELIKNNTFNLCLQKNLRYSNYLENGKLKGSFGDIYNEISKLTGLKFNYVMPDSYDDLNKKVALNQCDAVTVIGTEQKRFKNIIASKVVKREQMVAVGKIEHIGSVNFGKDVFYSKFLPFIDELKKHYPNEKYVHVKDYDKIATLLDNHKHDVLISPMNFANEIIQKYGYDKFKIIQRFPDIYHNISTGINENNPLLLSIINKSIEHIGKDKIDEIFKKYELKSFVINKTSYQWLWYVVAVLVLIILFAQYRYIKTILNQREKEIQVLKKEKEHTQELKFTTNLAQLSSWSFDVPTMSFEFSPENQAFHGLINTPIIKAQDFITNVHHDDQEYVQLCIQKAIENDEHNPVTYRYVMPDGSEKYVFAHWQAIYDSNGKFVLAKGYNKDITEDINKQKELEDKTIIIEEKNESLSAIYEELKIQNHELVEKEFVLNDTIMKFEKLFLSSPVALIIIDEKTLNVTKFNNLADDIFKFSSTNGYIKRINLTKLDIKLMEFVNNLKNNISFEVKFENKTFIVNSYTNHNFNEYIVSFFDVTKEKELQDEILKAKEEAIALGQAKSEFIANVSHEVRTPLNGIIGINDILLSKEKDKTQIELLTKMKKSSYTLLETVNDILDFSKLESGKFKLNNKAFSLANLSNDILDLFEIQAKEKGLEFVVENSVDFEVIADKSKINQVLNNLVGNAIKFTKKGFVKLEILEISKNSVANTAIVSFAIEDSGIGISDDDDIKKITEPFYQSSYNTVKGTGLGLSITKELVELMDGNLQIESYVDVGSRFSFELNFALTKENAEQKIEDETEIKKETKLILTKSKKALIVEDNEVNQMILENYLQDYGFEVSIAYNGFEAVTICKDEQFDIIFMDINMPILDGFTASIQLRYSGVETPIIAFSALNEELIEKKVVNCKMNGILGKPIDKIKLLSYLKSYFSFEHASGVQEIENYSLNIKQIDEKIFIKNIGSLEKAISMLKMFCVNYEDYENQLSKLDVKSKDFMDYIHKLKGVCGNIYANNLYRTCFEIEESVKNKEITEIINKQIDDLKIQLKELLAILKEKTTKENNKENLSEQELVLKLKEVLKLIKEDSIVDFEMIETIVSNLDDRFEKELKENIIKSFSDFDYEKLSKELDLVLEDLQK